MRTILLISLLLIGCARPEEVNFGATKTFEQCSSAAPTGARVCGVMVHQDGPGYLVPYDTIQTKSIQTVYIIDGCSSIANGTFFVNDSNGSCSFTIKDGVLSSKGYQ